jgi:hypothetical protein
MKSKLGPAAPTTATAHKIAIIFYTMVKKQVEYDESIWAQRDAERAKRFEAKLKRQAHQLGYKLIPIEESLLRNRLNRMLRGGSSSKSGIVSAAIAGKITVVADSIPRSAMRREFQRSGDKPAERSVWLDFSGDQENEEAADNQAVVLNRPLP